MLCVNHLSGLFSCKKGYSRFPLAKVLPAWNEGFRESRYRYICFPFFLKQADITGKEMCFDAVLPSDIDRTCFKICFHDSEVFFNFPTLPVDF